MLERFDYTSPRLRNLIPTNDLMRFIALKRIENALRQSWGPDTVAEFERSGWSRKVPAFGQCTVTALVVSEYFGGKFPKDSANDHYWNLFDDGFPADLSREQFPYNIRLREEGRAFDQMRDRDYMLSSPAGKKILLPERSKMLSNRVAKLLENDLVFKLSYKAYLSNKSRGG